MKRTMLEEIIGDIIFCSSSSTIVLNEDIYEADNIGISGNVVKGGVSFDISFVRKIEA